MAGEREQVQTGGSEAPVAGETIHLPGPSYLPVATGLGLTSAVVGIVLSPVLIVIGVVVVIVSVWRWIGSTRRDIDELPLEHH